eukprot:CAMPEP_0197022968 /NCGR_PEP_ID=MMETSP1384-20130603/3764_1 /TAXON_ID=29189 /ORGANISM="Ammonia sp." /LENGTH=195 /DNA_ID=CAMNT_0042451101 /DNA_START=98 /DNA_END=685 /DNA_ORIENTATION=+
MAKQTYSFSLCMILIVSYLSTVSQGTPRPTSRPTARPTDRPTSPPTDAYQTLSVTYNMAEVDEYAFDVLEADEFAFKEDIQDSVETAIDGVSNVDSDLVTALAETVTAVETDQKIDVDMEIRYYYTEAAEVRKSQETNRVAFQDRVQTLLMTQWNITSLVFTVDVDTIETTADLANTLSHAFSVIVVGIFVLIMV